jgi:hypothetical protein
VAEGGDGHLRYKLSKESAAKTLSLLFQDNFSGRAEVGLTGDDDFHFKVSPDGSSWLEAIVIDRTTGKLLIGQGFTDAAAVRAKAGAAPFQRVGAGRGTATIDWVDENALSFISATTAIAQLNSTVASGLAAGDASGLMGLNSSAKIVFTGAQL